MTFGFSGAFGRQKVKTCMKENNSGVEMTGNCGSTEVCMVNECKIRIVIINDKMCEIRSCLRA